MDDDNYIESLDFEESPYPEDNPCVKCLQNPCLLIELKEVIDNFSMQHNSEGTLFRKHNSDDFVTFQELENNQKRFLIYKECVKTKYGYLQRGERINLGLCVEEYIRKMYPSDSYAGFKEKDCSSKGKEKKSKKNNR
jgi:hypothetical protein